MARLRAPVQAGQARPPRVGLIVSADTTRDGEAGGDWTRGLTYNPETAGGYRAFAECADAVVDHDIDPAPAVDYQPWVLQVWDECTALSGRNVNMRDRIRRGFDSQESYAIARELWTGEVTRAMVEDDGSDIETPNLYLTNPDLVTVVHEGPVRLHAAVGLLERAVGDALHGGQAFLHVPREVTQRLPGLRREGQQVFTYTDNVIVPDAGYPGTPPEGTAPEAGTTWLYATGPVVVRRSPLTFDTDEPVRIANNRIYESGTKIVAATFDPTALFAVQVDLDLTPAA